MPSDTGRTGRPARILSASRELALKQGIRKTSMAQVAARAHVAKGTAYSYWPSKEALFLELIAWTYRDILADIKESLETEPSNARPGTLMLACVQAAFDQDLVRALLSQDGDVLGALVDAPEATELLSSHGALPLIRGLLPIWRAHGLAETHAPLEEQVGALELLALGYFTARDHGTYHGGREDPSTVLEKAVTRMLGSGEPSSTALAGSMLQDVAEASRSLLQEHIDALVASIPAIGRDERS